MFAPVVLYMRFGDWVHAVTSDKSDLPKPRSMLLANVLTLYHMKLSKLC